MAILEIRKYPDRVLKKKTVPITTIDRELQTLVDNMIETMYAAPGVGLAAPQVGISKRLAVVDVSTKVSEMPLLVLINPVILNKEGFIEFEEGCLSLPDFTSKVERAAKVVVHAVDREGKEFEIETEGLLSIALQHEIDHLNGILLIDRISPIKREFFKKRCRKTRKQDR